MQNQFLVPACLHVIQHQECIKPKCHHVAWLNC